MDELLPKSLSGISSTALSLVLGLAAAALYLPKLLNGIKSDGLTSSALARIATLEAQVVELSNSIHDHAVELTLAQLLILEMHFEMVQKGVPIPDHIQQRVDEIKAKKLTRAKS